MSSNVWRRPVNQLDAVKALGLLLRDRDLRLRFANDRDATVKKLNIAPGQRSFFSALDARQLDAQAESLIRKRRSEVSRLVPMTWLRLGTQAHVKFRQYADRSPWPKGHRRHLTDASMFCHFLQEIDAAEYVASEHQWVSFLTNDRSCSIRFLNDVALDGRKRWAVQICLRRHGVATRKAYRIRGFRNFVNH